MYVQYIAIRFGVFFLLRLGVALSSRWFSGVLVKEAKTIVYRTIPYILRTKYRSGG